MESDPTKNDTELTSTMGNFVQGSNNSKSESNDSTPTSSTDASTSFAVQSTVVDDPISSTSSEVVEGNGDTKNAEPPETVIEQPVVPAISESSSIVSAKDLLDMNISDVSTEKITENVDDIVQDLENLLGEPTTSFTFPIKTKRSTSKEEENQVKKEEVPIVKEETKESPLTEKIDSAIVVEESPSCSSSTEDSKTEKEVTEKSPEVNNEFEIIQLGNSPSNEATELKSDAEKPTERAESVNQEQIAESSTQVTNETEKDQEKVPIEVTEKSSKENVAEAVEKISETHVDSGTATNQSEATAAESASSEAVEESVASTAAVESVVEESATSETVVESALEESATSEAAKELAEAAEQPTTSEELPEVNLTKPEVQDVSATSENSTTPDTAGVTEASNLPAESAISVTPQTSEALQVTEATATSEIATHIQKASEVSEDSDVAVTSQLLEVPQPQNIEATDEKEPETSEIVSDVIEESSAVIESKETEEAPKEKEEIHSVEEEEEGKMEVDTPSDVRNDEVDRAIESITSSSEDVVKEVRIPESTKTEELAPKIVEVVETSTDEAMEVDEKPTETVESTTEGIIEAAPMEIEEPIESEAKSSAVEPKEVESLPKEEEENSVKIAEPEIASTSKINEEDRLLSEAVASISENQVTSTESSTIIKESADSSVPTIVEEQVKSSPDPIIRKELDEPLVIAVDDLDKEQPKSSKTKDDSGPSSQPDEKELKQGSLKMTITKQSNTMHSILKIYNPDENIEHAEIQKSSEPESSTTVPKLVIKPVSSPEQQHSPKISRGKPPYSPGTQRSSSPRITIKPIVKPEETVNPLKLTIKPIVKTEQKQSPKLTIKPIIKPEEESSSDEVQSDSGVVEPVQTHSPRITIKPIIKPEESKSEIAAEQQRTHSPKVTIKPIVKPDDIEQKPHSPRVTIKPIIRPEESESKAQESISHSPRVTIKPILRPDDDVQEQQKVLSPRLTIKPVVKPEEECSISEQKVGPKITIKPVLKPEETVENVASPRLTIKPIVKPADDESIESKVHSPRVTIKPVVKPEETSSETKVHSPRVTIKPIVKPEESSETVQPKITIKPVLKPSETMSDQKLTIKPTFESPKITIKPIIKPNETETVPEEPSLAPPSEETRERIVLKINVGASPSSSRETSIRKDDEKLAKIKLKFSKEGGHPHIVQDEESTGMKRPAPSEESSERCKRFKPDPDSIQNQNLIPPVMPVQSKLKEMLCQTKLQNQLNKSMIGDDDAKVVESEPNASPIVISEDSNQDSNQNVNILPAPSTQIVDTTILPPPAVQQQQPQTQDTQIVAPPVEMIQAIPEVPPMPPAPRKRGRPRKVPLQVREDFKDVSQEEPKPEEPTSSRPKRSCRGQSVKATLGIKPRKPGKPRGSGGGRGRGRRRGSGRILPNLPRNSFKNNLNLFTGEEFLKSTLSQVAESPKCASATDRADIVMYEEETRMSADTSSRAQTPAKQIVTPMSSMMDIEESQSSVLSTATTESVKVRKGPRLEVHQEPEGSVISADQLAEYYWGGAGPFMLQEQVAQFLGIKSFKRKYPNIPRRVVDMQERDFIRESGLACEAMCDLGLTAVNTADILDIMYSDFQDKYEEYCKHQRDRQAKDLTNKQRALSLAASQEKTKLDITQQAVQSAASWNINFNKARKTQRKACMDLQTLTVHYPKGKVKQINKPKIGHYPVALVPGQFTDYYAEFSPIELFRMPINSVRDNPSCKFVEMECDSQTDGSGSDSDSSSSDTDSSYSGSSDENCSLCKPQSRRISAI